MKKYIFQSSLRVEEKHVHVMLPGKLRRRMRNNLNAIMMDFYMEYFVLETTSFQGLYGALEYGLHCVPDLLGRCSGSQRALYILLVLP